MSQERDELYINDESTTSTLEEDAAARFFEEAGLGGAGNIPSAGGQEQSAVGDASAQSEGRLKPVTELEFDTDSLYGEIRKPEAASGASDEDVNRLIEMAMNPANSLAAEKLEALNAGPQNLSDADRDKLQAMKEKAEGGVIKKESAKTSVEESMKLVQQMLNETKDPEMRAALMGKMKALKNANLSDAESSKRDAYKNKELNSQKELSSEAQNKIDEAIKRKLGKVEGAEQGKKPPVPGQGSETEKQLDGKPVKSGSEKLESSVGPKKDDPQSNPGTDRSSELKPLNKEDAGKLEKEVPVPGATEPQVGISDKEAAWPDRGDLGLPEGKTDSIEGKRNEEKEMTFRAEDGTTVTQRPDGTTILNSAEGRIKVSEDGRVTQTVNGVEAQYDFDSLKRVAHKDGASATYILPDGTSITDIQTPGQAQGMVIRQPGGTAVEMSYSHPSRVRMARRN
ncbi:MAG: hypothetical protein K2X27_07565 [Candidatus Obscuribacterales bacterium]|nr:hypothetical protein [Candidatus Obscuribacterales bacterium]